MIILLSAMSFETAWISSQMASPRHLPVGKYIALQGYFQEKSVVLFNFGVGKTNAAAGTALLLDKISPSLVVLIGCAGAYSRSGLRPGDLAMADEEIFGDEGVITPQGWRSMQFLNLPLLRKGEQVYYNSFKIDPKDLLTAQEILQKMKVKVGTFITVSEVSGTTQKAKEMEARFHGLCENMEGAAVAQLCTLYGLPFLEIRGISNLVKERNNEEWNLPAAAQVSQQAAAELIANWVEK